MIKELPTMIDVQIVSSRIEDGDLLQHLYDEHMADEGAKRFDAMNELFKWWDSISGREDADGYLQEFQTRAHELGVTMDNYMAWKHPVTDDSIPF